MSLYRRVPVGARSFVWANFMCKNFSTYDVWRARGAVILNYRRVKIDRRFRLGATKNRTSRGCRKNAEKNTSKLLLTDKRDSDERRKTLRTTRWGKRKARCRSIRVFRWHAFFFHARRPFPFCNTRTIRNTSILRSLGRVVSTNRYVLVI